MEKCRVKAASIAMEGKTERKEIIAPDTRGRATGGKEILAMGQIAVEFAAWQST